MPPYDSMTVSPRLNASKTCTSEIDAAYSLLARGSNTSEQVLDVQASKSGLKIYYKKNDEMQ